MAVRRPRLWVAGIVVAVVAGAAVPTWGALQRRQERSRLVEAVNGYARAWQAGRFTGVRFAGAQPTQITQRMATVTAGLTPSTPDAPTQVEVASVGEAVDGTAKARLRVRWNLAGKQTWTYETDLALQVADGDWAVAWTPRSVHPQLADGLVLTSTRTPGTRGEIIGAAGRVLVTARPVVQVGIQPARVKHLAQTVAAVTAIVDVDAAALTKRVRAAKPNEFVDVITLRLADYQPLKAHLQPIPGTVFRTDTLSLAPTPSFARALLGTVGPATKEIVEASRGRIQPGDVTGLSGLQRAYDEPLTGTPGLRVDAVPEPGSTTSTTDPATPQVLYEVAAVPGSALTITLDERIQRAAEAALTRATKPAALVAVRPSTGEVLAVANGGPSASGYNRALIGQYPPGSTFKVVTSYALLQHGMTTSTPVGCPPSVTVSGKVFTNAENEVLGTVPFAQAFAQSCNTAFVASAAKVTGSQLGQAAAALGYGAANTLGTAAFMGSAPGDATPVEHAAEAIGQGKVLASPLTVVGVSAAIAAGRRMPLTLVKAAAPSDGQPSPAAAASPAAPASAELAVAAVKDVQTMMRGVVTGGTGVPLRNVPGGDVHGKTGTAEYGNANPPATHAWFTGFQGDLAFAVVVEGGGFGAKAAAPLAADFLTSLAS